MNEQAKSEFSEVNSLLEKRLYEYDEFLERIRRSILRFGTLQEPPSVVETKQPSSPNNAESLLELHRLVNLSDKLNKNNSYLQFFVVNLERLV